MKKRVDSRDFFEPPEGVFTKLVAPQRNSADFIVLVHPSTLVQIDAQENGLVFVGAFTVGAYLETGKRLLINNSQ
jgi:hypothetical protein